MAKPPRIQRLRGYLGRLRTDWVEIGGLGRLAVFGIVLALGVTLILGVSITRSARGHLLDARAAMVTANIRDLPVFSTEASANAAFDEAVRINVLGGETIRVKVWTRDGTIVYSDAPALIDNQFSLPNEAIEAFDLGHGTHISDLSDPAHAIDRAHGELIEFYVALPVAKDGTTFLVEVEQDASGLNTALEQITRNVWISIAIGLISVGLVMAVGIAARTREVNKKRRQAESLLRSSFRAQEAERRRVVGALHDDIGQPMYRLLYGIQGSVAKLDKEDPVSIELQHLADVVRDMDTTLRGELRLLSFELAADAGLGVALEELAELTRLETDLTVRLAINLDHEPTALHRTELYRAAREAITNVRKHANATEVAIVVSSKPGRTSLRVTDDGVDTHKLADPGLGLSTTTERFTALGGGVSLDRVPSGGTRFLAWLPQPEERS